MEIESFRTSVSGTLKSALRYGEQCKRLVNARLENANEQITAALFDEITRLRAELAKANALLLTYGWHRDECAFLEVCDDCDCGFEAILRKALTINKAARKGEGE